MQRAAPAQRRRRHCDGARHRFRTLRRPPRAKLESASASKLVSEWAPVKSGGNRSARLLVYRDGALIMEAIGTESVTKRISRIKFVRACRYLAGALTIAAALTLAGCYGPPTERDALLGGAVGAGGGALVGSAVGSPGVGAVVGGLAGAGTGYLIGNHQENEWRYRNGY